MSIELRPISDPVDWCSLDEMTPANRLIVENSRIIAAKLLNISGNAGLAIRGIMLAMAEGAYTDALDASLAAQARGLRNAYAEVAAERAHKPDIAARLRLHVAGERSEPAHAVGDRVTWLRFRDDLSAYHATGTVRCVATSCIAVEEDGTGLVDTMSHGHARPLSEAAPAVA